MAFGVGKWIGTFATNPPYGSLYYKATPNISALNQEMRMASDDGYALVDLAEGW